MNNSFYIQFPKIFADQIKPELQKMIEDLRMSFVKDEKLSLEQWRKISDVLITMQVALRTDEEREEDAKKWNAFAQKVGE